MIRKIHDRFVRGWLERGSDGQLLILQFHKIPHDIDPLLPDEISGAEFDRAMEAYSKWFNFLPLDEAVARLKSKDLPKRAAAITFDDGYADWFDHTIPALEKLSIPATFFITTEQLENGLPLWHERIARALKAVALERLPGDFDWGLSAIGETTPALGQAIRIVQERLKYLDLDTREQRIAELESLAEKLEPFRQFTAADVISIRQRGFQIGAHSVRHPILCQCTLAEAQREIVGSKEALESILHEPVKMFAYPNGLPGVDFLADHLKLVRDAGFDLALSTAKGIARPNSDIFQLPRYTPWARSRWRSAFQLIKNMNSSTQGI